MHINLFHVLPLKKGIFMTNTYMITEVMNVESKNLINTMNTKENQNFDFTT